MVKKWNCRERVCTDWNENSHKKAQEAQKETELVNLEFKMIADQFNSSFDLNFVLFVPFCG